MPATFSLKTSASTSVAPPSASTGLSKTATAADYVRVRGHDKVLCHLMFGILVLTVEQLMRFVT